MHFRCPNCNHAIDVDQSSGDSDASTLTCPSCDYHVDLAGPEDETLTSDERWSIGRFQIQDQIGEGAFGMVFRAWDAELERLVALKIPRKGRLSRDTARQVLREARSAAAIRHPNVVQVHEIGTHEDRLYIVSEYIDGAHLGHWLKNHPPDTATSATMVAAICDGVQQAHAAGVVHRDLKPGNVLVNREGQVFVTDFGMAHRDAATEITVTQQGDILGTPAYMSPEQARGDVSAIDARSDVYSIGVILYLMLTGRKPFVGSDARTLLSQIESEDPPTPRSIVPSVPRDLDTICRKAMRKEPDARYQSAEEFAADLRRFLNGDPILARPMSPGEVLWRKLRRYPVASASLVVAGLLAVALTIQALRPSAPDSDPSVVVREPQPLRHHVVIQGRRSDGLPITSCTWAVVPLDPRSREPLPDKRVLFHDVPQIEGDLEPGEYLTVLHIPGYGFHEVYRLLPQDPEASALPMSNHQRWTWDSKLRVVTWPAVDVPSEADATDGMVLIPGGSFEMGTGSKAMPKHQREVASFWIEPAEVTVREFAAFRLSFEESGGDGSSPDEPCINVSWNAATSFAESRGRRLLKEHEYEYVATNLGTAEFPSGNAADYQWDRWPYGPAGFPPSDRLPDYPVFGLYSNVAEWIDSLQFPYPGGIDHGPAQDQLLNLQNNRVVRGGPVALGKNDRSENRGANGTRYRPAWDQRSMDSEIGFRCARSARPRFVD